MNAVDTNILVYAVDAAEAEKSRRAQELIGALLTEDAPLILLWQVAVEFLACLRRWEDQGRIDRTQTQEYLDRFITPLPVTHPTADSLQIALQLSDQHSLSHWDSMLLAACIEAGIDTIYSEDLTSGATYGSVTVINPFL